MLPGQSFCLRSAFFHVPNFHPGVFTSNTIFSVANSPATSFIEKTEDFRPLSCKHLYDICTHPYILPFTIFVHAVRSACETLPQFLPSQVILRDILVFQGACLFSVMIYSRSRIFSSNSPTVMLPLFLFIVFPPKWASKCHTSNLRFKNFPAGVNLPNGPDST